MSDTISNVWKTIQNNLQNNLIGLCKQILIILFCNNIKGVRIDFPVTVI